MVHNASCMRAARRMLTLSGREYVMLHVQMGVRKVWTLGVSQVSDDWLTVEFDFEMGRKPMQSLVPGEQ